MNGNNIIVYQQQGNSWRAIAATKSDTINVDGEQIEIATSTAAEQDWKKYIAGRKSWNLSVKWLVTEVADIRKVLLVNTRIKLRIGARSFSSSTGLEGYAWVKSANVNLTRGNLAEGNFQFLGDGALT